MPTTSVADQLVKKLHFQWLDLWARVMAGSVDPNRASKGLQLVQEDRWDKQVEIPYANECVPSTLGYPDGFRHRAPAEQLEFWKSQKLTKKLDGSHVLDLAKRIEDAGLPQGAEGIGVWPKFSRLGGLYLATKRIFDLIDGTRGFKNWRGEEIGKKEYWRHTIKAAGCCQRLDEYQPGDYFVVPFQFGKLWVGASLRHGLVRYAPTEFGLCPYSGGCLLLTHPDRITGDSQLYMDLGGCEWSPNAGGAFYYSARFCWNDGRLNFDIRIIDNAYSNCGSASAFVPQC